MDEVWVSITEAAVRLTEAGDPIDRSTLSRYLKQHAEALPLKPSGKSNLVELGALAAHRGENIRVRMTPPTVGERPRVGADLGRRFAGSQSDGAARKAQADAELREMDLAVRRRQLTPVIEVDKAARDAIALMSSAFEQAVESDAFSAAAKYGWDERTVRTVLKTYARKGLAEFNRKVLEHLDAMRRVQDASDPADDAATVTTTDAPALQ